MSFDTLRADTLGCYGDRITRTPTLDALAARGVVFERAYASVPFTPHSLWSLLHAEPAVRPTYDESLAERRASQGAVAARFQEAGYLTAAVVGSSQLARGLGFDQGFEHYLDTYQEASLSNETTLARVFELRERVLEGGSQRPFFLYVHFFDPHTPWADAPSSFRTYEPEPGRFARITIARATFKLNPEMDWALWRYTGGWGSAGLRRVGRYEASIRPMYRSEVTWSDDVLRRLLDDFEAEGLLRDTFVAITSDHGIAFAEHYQTSGYVFSLFDEAVRVPLILLGPGLAPARVVPAVSLVDLGPTLLDLSGLGSKHARGRSLRPMLGARPVPREVYAEAVPMSRDDQINLYQDQRGRYATGPDNAHTALLEGHVKLIHMPARRGHKFEMFDLEKDPGETNDIFSPDDPRHRELADRLLKRRRTVGARRATKDREAEERLRALGYVR